MLHYKTKSVAAFLHNTGDDNLVMREDFKRRAAEEADKLMADLATNFKSNKVGG